ncbi:MAG: trehalose-phosphatase [Acidimicrobiia bacterium]
MQFLKPVSALPNALDRLDQIKAIMRSRPAIFLDYDGTLAPIVNDPAKARIPQSTRTAVRALLEKSPVAVVSGRSAIDVRDFLGLSGVVYAGSHGQEIAFPDDTYFENPASVEHLGALDKAERLLTEGLVGANGIQIERKPFAIAVHTRRAGSESDRVRAGEMAAEVGASAGLVVRPGKEVHELRPNVDWHKGRAIEFLLARLEGHVPLFIGDDETDEDGFSSVLKKGGVAIIVGDDADRRTLAEFKLKDTFATTTFLTRLKSYI